MTLHLAVLQHEPETTLGVFAPLLDDVELELVRTGGALPDVQAFDCAIVSAAASAPTTRRCSRPVAESATRS